MVLFNPRTNSTSWRKLIRNIILNIKKNNLIWFLILFYSFHTWWNAYVQNVFGRSSSKIYELALLASGQSCAVATSYSGQYIMQVIYKEMLLTMSISCAYQDTSYVRFLHFVFRNICRRELINKTATTAMGLGWNLVGLCATLCLHRS